MAGSGGNAVVATSASKTNALLGLGNKLDTTYATDAQVTAAIAAALGSVSTSFTGVQLGLPNSGSNHAAISLQTDTALTLIEIIDVGGYHEGVTNPTRVTIPTGKDGKYRIHARVITDGTSSSFHQVRLKKNATTFLATSGRSVVDSTIPSPCMFDTIQELVATDYLELFYYSDANTTIPKDAAVGLIQTEWVVQYLGT